MYSYRFVQMWSIGIVSIPHRQRTGSQAQIESSEGEPQECSTGLKPSSDMQHRPPGDLAHSPPHFHLLLKTAPSPLDPALPRRVRWHITFDLERLTAVAAARSRPYTVITTPGSSRKEDCRLSLGPPSQPEPPIRRQASAGIACERDHRDHSRRCMSWRMRIERFTTSSLIAE
jgi:hypothetical protein